MLSSAKEKLSPPSGRREAVTERILRSAVTLFSRLGYQRTSTRDIARLADVSEVTVYRHFDNKEEIFWAAIAAGLRTIVPRMNSLATKLKSLNPELALAEVLTFLEDIGTYHPEIPRLIGIAYFEHGSKAKAVCCHYLCPFLTSIEQVLSRHMEDRKIQILNRGIVIASLFLSMMARPQLSAFIEGCELSQLDNRNAVETYVHFWVNVLKPNANFSSAALGMEAEPITI